MSGVYQLLNIEDNNCYIGSSCDINYRFKKHLEMLRNKNHHNRPLQQAYDEYGESKIVLILLAKSPKEYLKKMEQWFINTLNPHYNIAKKVCRNDINIFNRKIMYGNNVEEKRVRPLGLDGFLENYNSMSTDERMVTWKQISNANWEKFCNVIYVYDCELRDDADIKYNIINIKKLTSNQIEWYCYKFGILKDEIFSRIINA